MVEKFSYSVAVTILVMEHQMHGADLVFACTDFLLGVLFVIAYVRPPRVV